ncbi:MAG TPA: TldD/PmbA family protein [Patescibacteria group bacterium]|nr:TldD/PmbA family protein [Patescibacteria group bacterium]
MKETLASLLDKSLASGAAGADALIKRGASREVRLEPGGGVTWTRTAEGGVALRVFLRDGACGFASACGPSPDPGGIDQIVRAALEAARAPAPVLALPSGKPGDGRGLGIFDQRLHAATPADLEGLLDDACSEALRADPRVRRLDSASIAASSSEVWLANSRGLAGSYRQTLVHLTLSLMGGEGSSSVLVRRSRTARNLAGFSPALFGDGTARLVIEALEGRPIDERVYPALIAPPAAAEILRAFARTLSPPGPPRGTEVGSRLLTIIDDGRLPGGIASAPFDGEGVPTRRTTVVERGRFEGMLHDLSSAARCSEESSGNGIRVSFRDAPRRMPSNFFIAPGSDTPEDLMSGLQDGVWIQSLRPAPSVLRRTGEYGSFTALAAGRRIVDGKPAEAISGMMASWPISGLLSGIVGIGNDLAFGFPTGSFGSPSILVGEIGLRSAS